MPTFRDLPDQAVEHILARLSVVDLARAAGTCTSFRDEARRRTAALRRELRRVVDAAWWAETTQLPSAEVPGIVWATYPGIGFGPTIVLAPSWPTRGYPFDVDGPRPTPWMKAQLTVGPVAIRHRKMVFHGFTHEAGFERTDVPAPDDDSIAAALTYFMWLSCRPDLHTLLLSAV